MFLRTQLFCFLLLAIGITSKAQNFTIENSEPLEYPAKQVVRALVYSDDQFNYYSTQKFKGGGGINGFVSLGGLPISLFRKAKEEYTIYIQKVDRKNLTISDGFTIEMDLIEDSKKAKNNIQDAEIFQDGQDLVLIGNRVVPKEKKCQLYAKVVDLKGTVKTPWTLILETTSKNFDEDTRFDVNWTDEKQFSALIETSANKDNEKFVQYFFGRDFKVTRTRQAIFPIRDKDNRIISTHFDGNLMTNMSISEGRLYLRQFDFTSPDSVQDRKLLLGDDQKYLSEVTFHWDKEGKQVYLAGAFQNSKRAVADDGFFIGKVDYKKLQVEYLQMHPFKDGYGKKAGGRVMFGGSSPNQMVGFNSMFIRMNRDKTITFAFRGYMAMSPPSGRGNTMYAVYGYSESRFSPDGSLLWLTYVPQLESGTDANEVDCLTRTTTNGSTEYFYLGSEKALTATESSKAQGGPKMMIYARVDADGTKTMKPIYNVKEMKALKELTPANLSSLNEGELNFLYYPSKKTITLGRILIKP